MEDATQPKLTKCYIHIYIDNLTSLVTFLSLHHQTCQQIASVRKERKKSKHKWKMSVNAPRPKLTEWYIHIYMQDIITLTQGKKSEEILKIATSYFILTTKLQPLIDISSEFNHQGLVCHSKKNSAHVFRK